MSRATQGSAMPSRTSRKGLSPATAGLSSPFRSPVACNDAALLPRRGLDRDGLGYSPVARHYWGNHCCFLFLRVLRCFSSPRSPHGQAVMAALQAAGLSHSEIRGSQAVCAYPRLFAAYHVLLRLREPRHPPCALALFFLILHLPYVNTEGVLALLVPKCQRPSRNKNRGGWRITDSNRRPLACHASALAS